MKWAGWLAFQIAGRHGWHDPAPTDGESAALVHSEVSELLEYLRKSPEHLDERIGTYEWGDFRGVEAEAADIVIRLLDWCHRRGWRLPEAIVAKMRYNNLRPYRHGGKVL